MYLQSIPRYENANIFGANWFTTEWYPSRQLVCSTEDAFLIALVRLDFCSAEHSFSYASDTVRQTEILLF